MVLEEPGGRVQHRGTGTHVVVAVLGVGKEGVAMRSDGAGQTPHGRLKLVEGVDHVVCEDKCSELNSLAGRREGAKAKAVWQRGVLEDGFPEAHGVVVHGGPLRVEAGLGPLLLALRDRLRRLYPLEDLHRALQLQAVLHERVLELGIHHGHRPHRPALHVDQLPTVRAVRVHAVHADALLEASRDEGVHAHAPLLVEPLDGDGQEEDQDSEDDRGQAALDAGRKGVAVAPHGRDDAHAVEPAEDAVDGR
mmetsp:Transcript_37966/g.109566  ORF Transcript_37966/g.109566 Transcript_37966/m.109566 type:complete len:250 (-) Transcript_37966:303-1052(-)